MKQKYKAQGIACFIAVPFWAWVFISLYDYLAHKYDNPTNFIVNITGLIGIAGAVFLIVYGIINFVKMGKAKK